jgi:hypothetical protein
MTQKKRLEKLEKTKTEKSNSVFVSLFMMLLEKRVLARIEAIATAPEENKQAEAHLKDMLSDYIEKQ